MRRMKDSTFDWIGKIPIDWKLYRGRYIFHQRSEKGNKINLQLLSPTQQYGVIPQDEYDRITGNRAVKLKEDTNLSQLKTIHNGDFCISLRSFQGGFEYSENEGVVSPAYQVFYPIMNVDRRYYKYLFKDTSFIEKMNSYTLSLRDGKNISFFDFGNTYIPYPSVEDQKQIADFLDKKCAEIDPLAAEIEKQISTLEAYKKSVITEAVTKGLDRNVEMKDSGIPWIGKIPKNWKTIPAKYIVTISHGTDPKTKGDIPVYGSGNSSFKTCGEFKIGPCVLLGRKGATLNIPHFITGKYWNVDTAFDVKQRNGKCNLRFFYYCSICFDYQFYISQTTLPGMTQKNYYEMEIPYPSLLMQQNIADYLDTRCSQIDSIIQKKQEMLANLDTYKKSLIYEYVTGKKEVPHE